MRAAPSAGALPVGPYVRFHGTGWHPRGLRPGVFFLVNQLAREGKLTAAQERARRAGNDWFDAAYTNPSAVDPAVYDPSVNPGAVAWFKPSAHRLLERVGGYLDILSAHDVPWERTLSWGPGRIVYEDGDQVVAVPEGGFAPR